MDIAQTIIGKILADTLKEADKTCLSNLEKMR